VREEENRVEYPIFFKDYVTIGEGGPPLLWRVLKEREDPINM
jgi:hypothetical protein